MNIPEIAANKLDKLLSRSKVLRNIEIYFVLSLPRSDMGKGTLVAHLLKNLSNVDAIKFDGLLNTNANGRHTAKGHDDFGIYEKYNTDRKFGKERYLLGGYLYKEFIELYGEYENLCFRPHFTKYFISKIFSIWKKIGKPRKLIVEIGGTISDWEVDPYITPAIRFFKDLCKDKCKVILLTEIDYNNQYIKTKSTQLAVEELLKRMIYPDFILSREPSEINVESSKIRKEFEKEISIKLQERFGINYDPRKIISVPFYPQDSIDKLSDFIKKRFIPLLLN